MALTPTPKQAELGADGLVVEEQARGAWARGRRHQISAVKASTTLDRESLRKIHIFNSYCGIRQNSCQGQLARGAP
jgi:hypothetical protein